MPLPDLDQRLDRELARLPRPRAPRTLLPRVMAAVASPAASGWSTWSRAWQAASLIVVLAAGGIVAWLLTSPPPPVAASAESAGQAIAIGRVLWDVVLRPAAFYLFAVGIVLTLVGAAVWAALELALGGVSQR